MCVAPAIQDVAKPPGARGLIDLEGRTGLGLGGVEAEGGLGRPRGKLVDAVQVPGPTDRAVRPVSPAQAGVWRLVGGIPYR